MPALPQLSHDHPIRRMLVALALGLAGAAFCIVLPSFGLRAIVARADNVFYDSFYRRRPIEDQRNGRVTIISIDDYSLANAAQFKEKGWPWPRDFYAAMIGYVEQCGAKAIVIDLLFSEPSLYRKTYDDDSTLADAVAGARIPIVLAAEARDGSPGRQIIPLAGLARLGAANLTEELSADSILRSYAPFVHGYPALATAAVQTTTPTINVPHDPFLLHYFGPFESSTHQRTFTHISAIDVLNAALGDANGKRLAPADQFKNKIVLIGGLAAGLYDQKASPLAEVFPGVEYQATALVDMLNAQFVHEAPMPAKHINIMLLASLGALAASLPRRAWVKLFLCAMVIALGLLVPLALFTRPAIYWLPPALSLLAALLAIISALVWSYFLEDRNRRFFLKALGQYVSPAVADELARDPRKLRIGAEDREITVLFTDIAGFTTISETMGARRVSEMLNFYLEELSTIVLDEQGTVDKYIGDAIMAFWNAPLEQPDHAVRACRAALKMHRRELAISPQLAALGAPGMLTRIGLNTGIMAVGNMGCAQKFNYTVLGDPVNLGSRLEGANKMYGSTIMLSQSVQQRIASHFLTRKLDLLRVKGKLEPIAVYELMDEQPANPKLQQLAQLYEAALAAYQRQDWSAAKATIIEILAIFPEDGPAETLAGRIAEFERVPPPQNWDGVYVADHK